MKHPNVPTSMDYTDLCNGCGLCCILPDTDPQEDCKHLQRLGNGLTLCKIHGKHTGSIIKTDIPNNKVWICNDIMDIPTLFEDCPYNDIKIAQRLGG